MLDQLSNINKLGADFNNAFIENNSDAIFSFKAKEPVSVHLKPEVIKNNMLNNYFLNYCNTAFLNRNINFSTLGRLPCVKEYLALLNSNIDKGLDVFINNNFKLKDFEHVIYLANNAQRHLITNIIGEVENGVLKTIWVQSKDATLFKKLEEEKYFLELKANADFGNTNYDTFSFRLLVPMPLTLNQNEQLQYLHNNLQIEQASKFMLARNGYKTQKEIVGVKYNALPKDNKENNYNILKTIVNNNYLVNNFIFNEIHIDNKKLLFNISVKAKIINNKLYKIYGVVKDITKEQYEKNKNIELASIVNNIYDAIFTCDATFKIISFNAAAEITFGINANEAIGTDVFNFVPKQILFNKKNNATINIAPKIKWEFEHLYKHPVDNRILTLLTTINKNENNGSYILISKDFTEQKAVDSKLIESDKRFKTLADQTPAMIWVSDEVNKGIYYNNTALVFLGNSLNEQLNLNWSSFVHHDDVIACIKTVETAIANKQPFEMEYRLLKHDGLYYWVIDKGVPRFLDNGTFIGYSGICIDINERKKVEDKLHESELRFRELADSAPVMIWLTDENDNAIYYNKGWLDITKRTLKEELKKPWLQKVHGDDYERVNNIYSNAVKNKIAFNIEYRLKTKNGLYKWILDKGSPRYLKDGAFVGYVGVCIEIQDLKATEEKLQKINQRYRLLNEATNEAIWDANLKTKITTWGVGYKRLFGYSNTEVTHEFFMSKVHPDDTTILINSFKQDNKFKTKNIIEIEYRFLKSNGNYAMVRDIGYVLVDNHGEPYRIIGSKKDITNEKNLEQKLAQAEYERQISINKAIIDGQERENIKMGLELHDNINQILSSAQLYLDVAMKEMDTQNMVKKSHGYIKDAITEIRKLSKSLHPSSIVDINLVDAIKDLIFDYEALNTFTIAFNADKYTTPTTIPNLNLNIYRIVQEQISNIIKHAKTNTITINLSTVDNFLLLDIIDFGIGFNITQKRNGIGFNNINNRASAFKGDVKIVSEVGKGCTLAVKIPI